MSSEFHFRLRNDLYCVGWEVKLYSLFEFYIRPISYQAIAW